MVSLKLAAGLHSGRTHTDNYITGPPSDFFFFLYTLLHIITCVLFIKRCCRTADANRNSHTIAAAQQSHAQAVLSQRLVSLPL